MYQNYIFDLYGTLLNVRTDETSKTVFKKFAKWLRREGYFFDWKRLREQMFMVEKKYRSMESEYEYPEIEIEDVFREVFLRNEYILNDDELYYVAENFRRASLQFLALYPDTLACLKGLKEAGKKIYLLSNAQRSYTWQELEISGILPYFDGVLISSDEKCMKPDPAFFNILCERYQLKKEECIMIGNELQSDIAGAFAAGMDAFFINRAVTFTKPEKMSCRFVSEHGSLLEVLRQTGVDCPPLL